MVRDIKSKIISIDQFILRWDLSARLKLLIDFSVCISAGKSFQRMIARVKKLKRVDEFFTRGTG